jgi:hypothetical protein
MAPEVGCDQKHIHDVRWAQWRALSQESHSLVILPTQADLSDYQGEFLGHDSWTWDRRKYNHVTAMIGLAADQHAQSLGVCKANVILAREGMWNGQGVYITQCLKRGQFVLDSYRVD